MAAAESGGRHASDDVIGGEIVRDVQLQVPVEHAAHVRAFRDGHERSASFTAVPGRGFVVLGASALVAAAIGSRQRTSDAWIDVWQAEAVIGIVIAGLGLWSKARRKRAPQLTATVRTLALGFVPPVLVGVLLTALLLREGTLHLLPGLWLLMYGTALVTAGAFSVRIVPVMGSLFMLLGCAALVSPAAWADAYMAFGFGVVHIGFGCVIARRHGG